MSKDGEIKLLERVAALQSKGTPEALTEACRMLLDYIVAREKGSDTTWNLGEPLFAIARHVPDRALRMTAVRVAAGCTDSRDYSISGENKEKNRKSITTARMEMVKQFMKDAATVEDPKERFELYLEKLEPQSYLQMQPSARKALALVPICFPEAHTRIAAYKRIKEFNGGEAAQLALESIVREAKNLPLKQREREQASALHYITYKEFPDIAVRIADAYLETAAEIPDSKERAKHYAWAYDMFLKARAFEPRGVIFTDFPWKQRKTALEGFFETVESVEDAAAAVKLCRDLLGKIPHRPDKNKDRKDRYESYRNRGAALILARIDKVGDFTERLNGWRDAAAYAAPGSADESRAITGAIALIGRVEALQITRREDGPISSRKLYFETVDNGWRSQNLVKAAADAWEKEMLALSPSKRLDALDGDGRTMHTWFGVQSDYFRARLKAVYQGAIAELPDSMARIDACARTIGRSGGYCAHPLEEPAMESFKKHIMELPEDKRMKTCWEFMDHDREQTMLPDPPFEQMVHAEWSRLHNAQEARSAAARKTLLNKIRSGKQSKPQPQA